MFGRTVGGELYSSLVRTVWGECIWIKGTRTKRYSIDRLNRSYGCVQVEGSWSIGLHRSGIFCFQNIRLLAWSVGLSIDDL